MRPYELRCVEHERCEGADDGGHGRHAIAGGGGCGGGVGEGVGEVCGEVGEGFATSGGGVVL